MYAGFQGYPRVGETYYVRVMVGGLGCSGMWVNPEIKLPPNTQLAIDASHPIRCFLGNFGAEQQITDGNCPTSIGSYTRIGGGFIGIPPQLQGYWPLPQGKGLRIEIPVVSSTQLFGIGSANDFVLGGAEFVDNSPGNPSLIYNAPPGGYSTGIPSSGAWQGVFVGPQAASYPTNPYFTFAEPSAQLVPGAAVGLRARLFARGYFTGCFCDSNQNRPLTVPACQNPYPGSGAPSCCLVSGVVQRSLVFNMAPVVGPDDTSAVGGAATPGGSDPQYEDVYYDFDNIRYGDEYEYNYAPLPGALYYDAGAECASTGNPPAATPPRRVRFEDPAAPVKYNLLANVAGEGSVTLDPAGGVYDPGTIVTATATADAGHSFTGWRVGSASSGSTNPYAIAVTTDVSLVAEFTADAPADDGGPTGGDGGGPSGGDGPTGGDGPSGTNDPNESEADGCNAAGPAIMELIILAGATLFCRKRPPAPRQ